MLDREAGEIFSWCFHRVGAESWNGYMLRHRVVIVVEKLSKSLAKNGEEPERQECPSLVKFSENLKTVIVRVLFMDSFFS